MVLVLALFICVKRSLSFALDAVRVHITKTLGVEQQTVRLACVRHAASVRPEPGSNSPIKFIEAF